MLKRNVYTKMHHLLKAWPFHIRAIWGSSHRIFPYTGTSLKSSDILGGDPNWSALIIETLAVLQKPGFLSGSEAVKVIHRPIILTLHAAPASLACAGVYVVGTVLSHTGPPFLLLKHILNVSIITCDRLLLHSPEPDAAAATGVQCICSCQSALVMPSTIACCRPRR